MPRAIAQNTVTKERNEAAPSLSLSDLEAEVIGLFVQISRILGQPRSYAEIPRLVLGHSSSFQMRQDGVIVS